MSIQTANPSELQLDARQIAMLQAMGVRVWSTPVSAPPLVSASLSPAAERPPLGVTPTAPHPLPRQAAATAPAPQRPAENPPALSRAPIPSTAHASALSWRELQQAVAECQRCGLCQHRKNTVFGVGLEAPETDAPPRVNWLLVGEAPGEQEDLAGEPFVGQAGKLLDNMLACLGLSRQSPAGGGLYIANTIKCRPPANRNPHAEEVAACAPWLARQIELLQPKLIVAMGRFAAQSLLAHSVPEIEKVPLGKLRGQLHRYGNTPVVVTYHPAYLLRNLPDKAKAWEDWVLAAQQVNRP